MPYAIASAAVMVASAVALGATIRGPVPGPTTPFASAEPTVGGQRATLSDTGRMAYWRSAASGQLELWVSDLDGGRRWTVATANSGSDVALTRWSPDGNAVAYVMSGQTLAVARLDGGTAYLDIPGDLRSARWRIVSYEWSPDSSRVAASLRAANGLSNTSEVFVVNVRAGSVFERLTTLGDAFAGRWASPTQLFVEEASGAVLVLDLETKGVRPLNGMPITSPAVGRDGRVYFVGGQFVVSDVTAQPVANGWIWSATIDGGDLRREIALPHDGLRLFGLLADGRPIVGVPGGVYVVGDAYVPLAFQAGTVRRVIVSGDGRRAVGLTDQRILLIDAGKIPRSAQAALPPADAASVLLSSIREADVWFPAKPAPLVRSTAAPPVAAPKAKLAFALGKGVYLQAPDGAIRSIATEQTGLLAQSPRWSPSGDRVAIGVFPPGNATGSALLVADTAGNVKRWDVPTRTTAGLMWTPDGKSIAVPGLVLGRTEEWATQLYDPDTGRPGDRIAGRAAYGGATAFVLTDGDLPSSQSFRVGQRIETGGRAITDATRLAAASALRGLPDQTLPVRIDQIIPSRDGQLIWLTLSRVQTTGFGFASSAVVVIRASDGAPLWSMATGSPQNAPADVAWAPTGPMVVSSAVTRTGGVATYRTVVTDASTGRTAMTVDGRAAGWSPDGAFVYVSRDEGLVAYPAGGGDPLRIGPVGVQIAAAKP